MSAQPAAAGTGFGWVGIVRLGLVQAMLGAVVVLTTSTLNRVMVVELALPALLPGLLVALHYAVQLTRPRMGWGSDVGGRRTPWILGGMLVLALGGFLAAVATAWMHTDRTAGTVLAMLAFTAVGLGVSASGTSLLVLLAKQVDEPRRAAAAATVWVMMIVGFAVTAGLAGRALDPYGPLRLVQVSGAVSIVAVCVTALALWRLEAPRSARAPAATASRANFLGTLAEVWREDDARRFTVFVFFSMLAYSTQDLILEPFAGAIYGFTPGESTSLAGVQHLGTLAGMLLAALAGRRVAGARLGSLKAWTVGGCVASAIALAGLVAGAALAPEWPLRANVFVLGVANGAFSIAAIGSMMSLAGAGAEPREGTRMGLWGAAQAVGFALGGLFGSAASDLARWLLGDPARAYGSVFALEAVMFLVSAALAWRIRVPARAAAAPPGAGRAEPAARPDRTRADTPGLAGLPAGGPR
jgi:BCD family chlorophyll transporter-like MFS transporter